MIKETIMIKIGKHEAEILKKVEKEPEKDWSLEIEKAIDEDAEDDICQGKISHSMRVGCKDPEGERVVAALNSMIGCRITDAGFVYSDRENGMAFEFITSDNHKRMRLVIGYNELGEWVKCLKEIKR